MNDNLTVSYYTCKLYNISVITTISYIENQVLTSTIIYEKEFTNLELYAHTGQSNYCLFYNALYNRIKGFIYIARAYNADRYTTRELR